ncbi:MAG TPA: hypothetical protein DEB48_09745, partial [Verrucomicrobiales bacterium]|nr:hypothetical protein [Verrucomicrobiales bacterium]
MFFALVVNADWLQFQGDARRTGNVPEAVLTDSLALAAAIPLTDIIQSGPVIAGGVVYVMDGSGVIHAIDSKTFQKKWVFKTDGGLANCNNVATPAVVGDFLHVGTTAGFYYVIDRKTGKLIHRIDCKEPIFSAPAVGNGRVYFATLG